MTPDESPTAPAPSTAPAPAATTQPSTPAPAAPQSPSPAPGAVSPDPQPNALAPEGALDRANREARERLAEMGTAVPPGPGEAQGRKPDGTFKRRENVREVGAPDKRNASLEGPEAEDEAQLDAGPEAEAQEPPPEAEGEAAAAPEGEAAEGEADGEADDALVVMLPPRREGEEPIPYELGSKEEAEDFRRLVNGYMRGEQAREHEQQTQDEIAQIEEMREYALTDPAGFLLTVSEGSFDPAHRAEMLSNIALHLLTQPDVWQQIGERVMNFDDPTERRIALADARDAREAMAQAGQRAVNESRIVQQNFRDVQNVVTGLMDEGWDEGQQTQFYGAALGAVKEYAERMNLLTVAPQHIPVILSGIMAEFGLNAVEAAQRVAGARAGKTTARSAATKRPAATQPAPKSAPARRTAVRRVEDVQRVSQQRRAAAALPGGGKGAPTSVPTPPAGMSIEQATAWHRQQNVAGRRLLNT